MNRHERRAASGGAHVHKLVAKTAKEFAGLLYSELMSNNQIYAEWKRQHPGCPPGRLEALFIVEKWGQCIPAARATLATMLTGPYPEELKEEIHEALCLDNTLIRGRKTPTLPQSNGMVS